MPEELPKAVNTVLSHIPNLSSEDIDSLHELMLHARSACDRERVSIANAFVEILSKPDLKVEQFDMSAPKRYFVYLEFQDLSEEAQEIFREFARGFGLASGQPWDFEVGEYGEDSVFESWVGPDKMKKMNEEFYRHGLKDGDEISVIFDW